MGWVQLGNSRAYIRSIRSGRRVLHEYFGGGFEAKIAAMIDAQRHSRIQEERAKLYQDNEMWAAASEPLDRLVALSDLLVGAVFSGSGYYQHNGGGEWRKRSERDV